MPIRIDDAASPDFQRALAKLKKKYRSIERDLQRAYEAIAAHPTTACSARQVPGTGASVWKYRSPQH